MAGDSSIEWTNCTWNPTRGCSRCSPGCLHCYAEGIAARFSGPGLAYEGLAKMTKAGPRWTGKLRLVEDALDAPLRWSRPRRIFVNSMSDLFHEALTIEQIAEVFAVMYLAPRHTFQVLTKRAVRMHQVLTDERFELFVRAAMDRIRPMPPGATGKAWESHLRSRHFNPTREPAPWVHLGVSVENEEYLHERAPYLVQTPGCVKFFSCEPLLDQIDVAPFLTWGRFREWAKYGLGACDFTRTRPIDWVIVGGESGPGARPFEVDWARIIVQQCAGAGVPCFVKQLGAQAHGSGPDLPQRQAARLDREGVRLEPWESVRLELKSKKGNNPKEWAEDLRVRQFPEVRRA